MNIQEECSAKKLVLASAGGNTPGFNSKAVIQDPSELIATDFMKAKS